AFTSCQAVAARLIADARPGAMVNISSIASKGQPLLAGYGAAKAGLDSLTRSMAMEWGRHGIRVNNVAPGTVNTPRSGRPVDDPDDPLAKGITLGRRGTPTDISGPASSPEESPQATRYRPGSTSTASPRSSMRATWSSAVRRSTRSTIDIST
ncbi:MAG: SDR family oxidoreductase, partial [Actinobacteria bacterium]|nr:SDR family oxidoreductase [Actinomycetota bacterium]